MRFEGFLKVVMAVGGFSEIGVEMVYVVSWMRWH